MNNKISNMHMIEVEDDDKDTYSMPVASVEDVPRQEWFDLMVECGAHVSIGKPGWSTDDHCAVCNLAERRIHAAEGGAVMKEENDGATKELLDWLDAGAAEAMRFRELLLKGGAK